jgi:uncharacterized protein YegP (UPF0339 family)
MNAVLPDRSPHQSIAAAVGIAFATKAVSPNASGPRCVPSCDGSAGVCGDGEGGEMRTRVRFVAALLALAVLAWAVPTATAQKDKDKDKDKAGTTFEIYQDGKKEWRWRYKAANGEILATPGQGYKAKADAKQSVDALRDHADTHKAEFYEDKKKEHRWRLKAKNGQIVAVSSEGYKTKADAEKGLESLTKGAKTAKVVEIKDKDK